MRPPSVPKYLARPFTEAASAYGCHMSGISKTPKVKLAMASKIYKNIYNYMLLYGFNGYGIAAQIEPVVLHHLRRFCDDQPDHIALRAERQDTKREHQNHIDQIGRTFWHNLFRKILSITVFHYGRF